MSATEMGVTRRVGASHTGILNRLRYDTTMLTTDLVAIVVAGLITGPHLAVLLGFLAVVLLGCAIEGLYRERITLSMLDDLPRLARVWLIAAVVPVVAHFVFGQDLSVAFLAVSGLLLLMARTAAYFSLRAARRHGLICHKTIIVGVDAAAKHLAELISQRPALGMEVQGFVDSHHDPVEGLAAPILGTTQTISKISEKRGPHTLIISQGALTNRELVSLVRGHQRMPRDIFMVPRLPELTSGSLGSEVEMVWDLPLVRLRRAPYRSIAWKAKRAIDLLASGLAIIVLSPVLAACALAARISDGPGVIFKQVRIGADGREFEILKFRSMRPANSSESQTQWSIANDNRVSKVGRFLRKTSLDELPQLFNILKGEMSLVGPRPERPHFVEQFGDLYTGYDQRHRVPCGLTGWAQVNGLRGGDSSIQDRANFDNWYIENWSLWLDIKIILRTVEAVFRSPGT